MIQKINDAIQRKSIGTINSQNIFIADFKKTNGGDVIISDTEPSINSIYLSNENNIEIHFIAFKDNALKVETEEGQVKQCECVLFPSTCNPNDWILFAETKYTDSLTIALAENTDYPNTMISQIISTVLYFREKGIIEENKRVSAILSFPTLIENFSESFFTRSELTPEEILIEHNILMRPSNEGKIISQKRIKI